MILKYELILDIILSTRKFKAKCFKLRIKDKALVVRELCVVERGVRSPAGKKFLRARSARWSVKKAVKIYANELPRIALGCPLCLPPVLPFWIGYRPLPAYIDSAKP